MFARNVFLVEFLLTSLAFMLETLDDINGAADMAVITIVLNPVSVGGREAGSTVLPAEGVGCAWEGFCMRETGSGTKRCETYCLRSSGW